MNRSSGRRLIFVGGSPRSGTTLVQNILDSHPQIFGGPEFDRIPDIIRMRNALYASIDNGRIVRFCSKYHVDSVMGNMIENLLLPAADENNAMLLSEKTPANIFAFIELAEIFSESRFIFVIRDPRAVISSMLEVGRRAKHRHVASQNFTRNLFSAMRYVEQCFQAGFQSLDSHPERIKLIFYEKLVSDPDSETKEICDFLKLPWYEGMVYPSRKIHAGGDNLDGLFYDMNTFQRDPVISEIDKWEQNLTVLQQAIINIRFGRFERLIKSGYEFDMAGFSWIHLGLAHCIMWLISGAQSFIKLVGKVDLVRDIIRFTRDV